MSRSPRRNLASDPRVRGAPLWRVGSIEGARQCDSRRVWGLVNVLKALCIHPHQRASIRTAPESEIAPRRITHDIRSGKLIFLPASFEFAPACREDVLHPLGLAAVGEGHDESIDRSKDVHRSSVDLRGRAPHVRENAESGHPTCKQAGDAVCERDVDLRQPSPAEPHHESA